jgi:adenosylcobinamide kinase/adenosylcobinamide-phosphate guanylyltransferase
LKERRILVLGGARSGKSQFAQDLAQRSAERVLFVATAEALDEEMKQRILDHQGSRPKHWRTLEAPIGVGERTAKEIGDAELVIVDCITLLVSNLLTGGHSELEDVDFAAAERRVETEIEALVRCMESSSARFIVISNEVGLGLVPLTPLERAYRDILGRANQQLAQDVDEVYLLVAGISLKMKSLDAWEDS